jgi:stage II sporulation protein D
MQSFAQEVRLELLSQKQWTYLYVQCTDSFHIQCDTINLHIPSKHTVVFMLNGINIQVKTDPYKTIQTSKASFSSLKNDALFALMQNSKSFVFKYEGEFSLQPNDLKIQVINSISLEEYVAGVVEAEGGANKPLEYYKVQAILSRTYALRNHERHVGYDVCDGTHCQVYHGISKKDVDIFSAVKATENLVIVDSTAQLITAFFHSNCGGQTCSAQDVWTANLYYCVGKKDPYCMGMLNSTWKKSISANDWKNYLTTKNISINDSDECISGSMNCSSKMRPLLYIQNNTTLSNKDMRTDLKLKSAYFHIEELDNEVILHGRGFGHGVGLCQEGAMNMAKKGKSAEDILHFYFSGVHILPFDKQWLFNENLPVTP